MALFKKLGNVLKQTKSASNSSPYQAIRSFSSKLYVGGLSDKTDEQALTQAFKRYGHVTEAEIVKDDKTGNSKGFGFVSFGSDKEASSALDMDGRKLNGRKLKVKYASNKPDGRGHGNSSGGYFFVDGGGYYSGVGSESGYYGDDGGDDGCDGGDGGIAGGDGGGSGSCGGGCGGG